MGKRTSTRLIPLPKGRDHLFLFLNKDLVTQKDHTARTVWFVQAERTSDNSKNPILQNGRRAAELFSCSWQ